MKLKTKEIIVILIFMVLLCCWGIIQTGLKSKPQIFLIIIGFITFGFSYFKNKLIFKIPFYLIFGMILLASSMVIIKEIMDIFLPNRGLVEFEGELHGTNGDPYILRETICAGVITIGLLLFYELKLGIEKGIEKYFILGFSCLTSIIWVIYEL